MSTDRFDAFAHAAKTVALARNGMFPVVLDNQAAMPIFGDKVQTAGCGACMANDISDGFA